MADDDARSVDAIVTLAVDDGNALWLPGYEAPDSRAEIYGISISDVGDPEKLLSAAEDCIALANHLRYAYEIYRDDLEVASAALEGMQAEVVERRRELRAIVKTLPENADAGPAVWLPMMSPEEFSVVRESVATWLTEGPDWDDEGDYSPIPGDGRTAAMKLLQTEDGEILHALGIVIIEGEHPGSTYYAAKLEKPIDEANRESRRLGVRYRFVMQ